MLQVWEGKKEVGGGVGGGQVCRVPYEVLCTSSDFKQSKLPFLQIIQK